MDIIWHGHSCFELRYGGYSLVIDPYDCRAVSGYPELRLRADMALSTHDHYDHNHFEAVELKRAETPCPFEVEKIASYHDVMHGRLRGPNDMLIIRGGGMKIVHMGDQGCRPADDQIAAISGADALMIPVGGIFTIDAAQAKAVCDAARPRVIFPMHFGGEHRGNRRLYPPEAFTSFFDAGFVRYYGTDTLALDGDTPAQVAMLKAPEMK